jgi:hypothetical protein
MVGKFAYSASFVGAALKTRVCDDCRWRLSLVGWIRGRFIVVKMCAWRGWIVMCPKVVCSLYFLSLV